MNAWKKFVNLGKVGHVGTKKLFLVIAFYLKSTKSAHLMRKTTLYGEKYN